MKEKRFPFRLCIQFLVFSTLLTLCALVAIPLWRLAVVGAPAFLDDLVEQLEAELGRDISFSSISPSIFSALDIRDLNVAARGEEPVLSVGRLRVSYSLADLVLGRTLAIRSVILYSPVIHFDSARDLDILDLLRENDNGLNGAARGFSAMFQENAVAQVRNGELVVRNGNYDFQVAGLNIAAEINGSRAILDGAWGFGFSATPPGGAPVAANVEMRMTGSACLDTMEGSGYFTIPSITGDIASVRPLVFEMAFSRDSVEARMESGEIPAGAHIEFDFSTGETVAGLSAQGFKLGDLVSLSGGLGAFRQILDVELYGGAWLRVGEDGELDYFVDMAGSAPLDGFGGLRGTEAAAEIRVEGDRHGALVRALRVSLPETDEPYATFSGAVAFSGSVAFSPLFVYGDLLLDSVSALQVRDLSASVALQARDGEIIVETDALRLGESGYFANIAAMLSAESDSGEMSFEASLLWPDGSHGGAPGSAALSGTLASDFRHLDARVVLSSLPAPEILEIVEIVTGEAFSLPEGLGFLLDDTRVSAEVFVNTDFQRLSYSAPSVVISGGGSDASAAFGASFSLSGTSHNISFRAGSLYWGNETMLFSGSAAFDFLDGGSIPSARFWLDAAYRDVDYFLSGTIGPGLSARVSGPGGFFASLGYLGDGAFAGSVFAEGFPVPLAAGLPVLFSIDADFSLPASGEWSFDVASVGVANIDGPVGLASAFASGRVDARGAVFTELVYEDAIGAIYGSADFSWPTGGMPLGAVIRMSGGSEIYSAMGIFENGELTLVVSAASAHLSRFSTALRGVVADGDLRLTWDPGDDEGLRAEADIRSVRGAVAGQEFRAGARVTMDSERIAVSDFRASLAGFAFEAPSLLVSREEGRASGSVVFGGAVDNRPVGGAVELSAEFAPVESWAQIGGALDAISATARVSDFAYGAGAQGQNFDFEFSRYGGAMALSGGPRNMLRFHADGEDNFFLALSSPFPVRGVFAGSISNGQIDASASDIFVDLGPLFDILPEIGQPGRRFHISDGYVTGSIEVRGSLRDPEFYGFARGTAGRIHVPFVGQELRPIPFVAVFDGDEIRFGPVPTAVGAGAGTVSATFWFERWIPDTFVIDIAVPRETSIPYRVDISGFTAEGDAAGVIRISMENRVMDVRGDLWGTNTLLGVDLEEIGQGADLFAGTRIPVTLDLTITTGPNVEFVYPNVMFPIVRATPEMGTRIYVGADSAAGQFSVYSDVRIRSGEIFYVQRSFYIRSGLLVFRENERGFDPRLTVRAEIRDRTSAGPVTISMVVDDEPITSFNTRFESFPPLSQAEILGLLGHGFAIGSQMAEGAGIEPTQAFLAASADLFAQFTVVRAIEQQIRNFTRLDVFSVRTQALQNAVFMATGVFQPPPRPYVDDVDTGGRLGHYFDNTTIFGGRYFGQNMFVQGMLSMRAEPDGSMSFQPDIGIDLQGPTIGDIDFRIRWDFVPMHPENWFVNDNSITLTFSRLF